MIRQNVGVALVKLAIGHAGQTETAFSTHGERSSNRQSPALSQPLLAPAVSPTIRGQSDCEVSGIYGESGPDFGGAPLLTHPQKHELST